MLVVALDQSDGTPQSDHVWLFVFHRYHLLCSFISPAEENGHRRNEPCASIFMELSFNAHPRPGRDVGSLGQLAMRNDPGPLTLTDS